MPISSLLALATSFLFSTEMRSRVEKWGQMLENLVEAKVRSEALGALVHVLPGIVLEECEDLMQEIHDATQLSSDSGPVVSRDEWNSIVARLVERAKLRLGTWAHVLDEGAARAIAAGFLAREGYSPESLAAAKLRVSE